MTVSAFDRPLTALHADLRNGRLTATGLAQEGLDRQRRYGEALGAYVYRNDDTLRAQARAADAAFAVGSDCGALQGLPVSIKDLYSVNGWPLYAGSPKRLPQIWERDARLVAAMRMQLPVFTGKTHTVEFAFGGLGTNPHWPVPRNPWDAVEHRVPGGSSAGAGVSLHSDAVIAIGSDTGGSGRIPASMTGGVGMKASYGLWSLEGAIPLCPSVDSAAYLTRTAADAQFVWYALDGHLRGVQPPARYPQRSLKDARFAICDSVFWDDCSPGVAEAVQAGIAELARAGAQITRVELPEIAPAVDLFRQGHLAGPEFHEFLHSELPEWALTLDPRVAARVADAGALSAQQYLQRKRLLAGLARAISARFDGVDALLAPTVPLTPPVLESLTELDAYRRANMLALRNTCPANMLQLCALSLPVGFDAARMPVGLQIIAPHGADTELLALAVAVERTLGTAQARLGRPPRVPA